jgi:hypothetical protein
MGGKNLNCLLAQLLLNLLEKEEKIKKILKNRTGSHTHRRKQPLCTDAGRWHRCDLGRGCLPCTCENRGKIRKK